MLNSTRGGPRERGRSGIADCHVGDREARQVHCEDASGPRQIPGIDSPAVGLDRRAAEGEPEAQTAAVCTSLLERTEQFARVTPRQPAAFILNIEQYALRARTGAQRHGGVRPGKLEGVLEQIRQHRGED